MNPNNGFRLKVMQETTRWISVNIDNRSDFETYK